MQRKWDTMNSTTLQSTVRATINPIEVRHKYYIAAVASMLKSTSEHFFTETNKDKFLEVTRFISGEQEQPPVNNQLLSIPFESLDQFTQTISNSGLGLQLNGDFFVFPFNEGLTLETVQFMKQFAHALSACRICFGIKQIYQTILDDPHIQTGDFERFLTEARGLSTNYIAGPKPEEDYRVYLRAYYVSALAMQKRLKEQHNLVNSWKEPFVEKMQKADIAVCEVLKATGLRLIEATEEFPDNTWLGNGWNPFIIGLINQLVAGYYSYSLWIAGSLSLNLDYFPLLTTELATFSMTMQDQMERLKLAFLQEADVEIGNVIRDIQSKAVLHQIVLIQEQPSYYRRGTIDLLFQNSMDSQPKTGIFDSSYASTSYDF